MEKIFSAHLHVDGKNLEYHVVFENDLYVFTTDAPGASIPKFSFEREHAGWKSHDHVDHHLEKQAVNQLEKYLLSQH